MVNKYSEEKTKGRVLFVPRTKKGFRDKSKKNIIVKKGITGKSWWVSKGKSSKRFITKNSALKFADTLMRNK